MAQRYPESRRRRSCPRCGSRRSSTAGSRREAIQEVARGARPDAGLLHVGRELLRHVPSGARRPAHDRGVHERLAAASSDAQAVLEAFERELGIGPGETTADGEITLRAVECLGGCADADGRRRRPPLPAAGARRRTCPRSWRSCVAAEASPALVLGGAEEHAADATCRVPRRRRLRGSSPKARAMTPQRGDRGADRVEPARPRRRVLPDGPQGELHPAPEKIAKPMYITVNADESEPGTFKDREIMLRVPHRLVEGCLIAAHAIQSQHVFIYIRGEYSTEYEVLQAAVDEAQRAGAARRRDDRRAPRRRRVHLRRGDGAARVARGQARPAALEAAVPGDRRPLRVADARSTTSRRSRPSRSCSRSGRREYAKIGAPPDSTGTRVFCLSGNVVRPRRVRARARPHHARADRGDRRRRLRTAAR